MVKSILDDSLPFASEGKNKGKLEEKYQPIYEAWQANPADKRARGQLLKAVSPVVDQAVYTYAGSRPNPSVKSRARILAAQAFDTYQPDKGSLKNHLMGQLRGLQRYAGKQNQMISVPERVSLDRRHLMESEEELRNQLGRDPSDLEISDYTGLSPKRLGYIRAVKPGTATGGVQSETGEPFSPASSRPGETSREDALRDFVYYDLHNTDRVIMDYTLGLHGAPVLSSGDIARRLGITPGAVSQRKKKIQALLETARNFDLFGEEE